MSSMGCCGRSVSLQGLIARADAYPASSVRGQRARARLVYTIAAGKAVQMGNRQVYERAMAGLRGLGDEGGASLAPHETIVDPAIAAAQAEPISATLRSIINQAAPQAAASFRQVQSIAGVLAALASLGTGIAGLVPGADANAIRVINMIISWIRTLFNGTAPTIPTLSPSEVQGLVGFCRFKEVVRGVIGTGLGIAAGIVSAQGASSGSVDASALAALESIRAWTDAILNGICNIPQVAAAAQAASDASQDATCRSTTPNSVWDPVGQRCVCASGFTPQNCGARGPGCDCLPAPSAPPPSASGPIQLTVEQRNALYAAQTGRALTSRQQALLRPLLIDYGTAGTLDPVTRCAPGEFGNPCNSGICDGPTGFYTAGMTCVNGVPTKPSSGGAIVPLAFGAGLLWYLLK